MATMESRMQTIGRSARAAALAMTDVKQSAVNGALRILARRLKDKADYLRKENAKDLAAAKKRGLSPAMIDRLTVSPKTIKSMCDGVRQVARLTSPVGAAYDERKRPNGLVIRKVRVPIGVVGIIYESRPNVTIDAAAIC